MNSAAVGQEVTYNCDSNYHLADDPNAVSTALRCLNVNNIGQWNGLPPNCEGKLSTYSLVEQCKYFIKSQITFIRVYRPTRRLWSYAFLVLLVIIGRRKCVIFKCKFITPFFDERLQ